MVETCEVYRCHNLDMTGQGRTTKKTQSKPWATATLQEKRRALWGRCALEVSIELSCVVHMYCTARTKVLRRDVRVQVQGQVLMVRLVDVSAGWFQVVYFKRIHSSDAKRKLRALTLTKKQETWKIATVSLWI